MCQIETQFPDKILSIDQRPVQRKLDTRILQSTHVFIHRLIPQRRSHRTRIEQVFRTALEEIERTGYTVVPQGEVDADIEIQIGFPLQFRSGNTIGNQRILSQIGDNGIKPLTGIIGT